MRTLEPLATTERHPLELPDTPHSEIWKIATNNYLKAANRQEVSFDAGWTTWRSHTAVEIQLGYAFMRLTEQTRDWPNKHEVDRTNTRLTEQTRMPGFRAKFWKCTKMVQTFPTKSTLEAEYWRIASNEKTLWICEMYPFPYWRTQTVRL